MKCKKKQTFNSKPCKKHKSKFSEKSKMVNNTSYDKKIDPMFNINPKSLFKNSKSEVKTLRINSITKNACLNSTYQKAKKTSKLLKGMSLLKNNPKLSLFDLGSEENFKT